MNEQEDKPDPVEPDPAADAASDLPPAPRADSTPPAAPFAEPPAPATAVATEAKPRWRDRVFRMRAVAAVAVAGVIIGAAGGAVTTALVSGDDHGDRNERFRIGPAWGPGMPAVPPGGRERFPGDEGGDGGLPEMPFPPGSESGTDDGTDQESLYQS